MANINTDDQIVISGDKIAVARAMDLAGARGARKTIPLSVSGAFHSSRIWLDPQSGRKISRPEDAEEAALIGSNHVLDLTGTIKEYFITNMPMKPLCQLDCRGLAKYAGPTKI